MRNFSSQGRGLHRNVNKRWGKNEKEGAEHEDNLRRLEINNNQLIIERK